MPFAKLADSVNVIVFAFLHHSYNRAYEALVQALKITIARLKKQRFGASSEKIEREIEQLELALESLETARAAADTAPEQEAPESDAAPLGQAAAPDAARSQRRRGKPRIAENAPRETIVLDPGERCPDCGGVLRPVGEDVAGILDVIAAKLKVVDPSAATSWARAANA